MNICTTLFLFLLHCLLQNHNHIYQSPVTPNMKDMARACDCAHSTVSLALRNSATIPAATREKIREAAARLGYRPNALVSALMVRLKTGVPLAPGLNLAYVTAFPEKYGYRDPRYHVPDVFGAAVARAEQLGFALGQVWLAEPEMTAGRFRSILKSRNIDGLIMAPLPKGVRTLDLPMESIAAVTIGGRLLHPALHRIAEDHFGTAQQAVDICVERGYRRIGFCLDISGTLEGVGDKWIGGYYSRLALASHLGPPCLHLPVEQDRQTFLAWHRAHQPDVIISAGTIAVQLAAWLRESGVAVPQATAILTLARDVQDARITGFGFDQDMLGRGAVDLLVDTLYRNERGIPEQAKNVYVKPRWFEAETLPSRETIKP